MNFLTFRSRALQSLSLVKNERNFRKMNKDEIEEWVKNEYLRHYPSTLTKENASRVSTIISKQNPEWGTKRFNYNEQPLNDGKSASTFGSGVNSAVLFEGEYHFWNVATWR